VRAEDYAVVLQTAPSLARDQEAQAFDTGIALMEEAHEKPAQSPEAIIAARYIQRLWRYLLKDVNDPANELSDDLKANLVSIGLFVFKETDRILASDSTDWTGLIEINRTVREGLSS